MYKRQEQEGTYPLPEAQVDRFMLKVVIDYPKMEEELSLIHIYTTDNAAMIAITGYFKYQDKDFCSIDAPAYSRVTLKWKEF